MSESVVEHIWAPPTSLPMTILAFFPLGACAVWNDEDFVAAIPATNEQTDMLADLFAAGDRGYFAMRNRLCGKLPCQWYSDKFEAAMEKMYQREEAIRQLASRARLN